MKGHNYLKKTLYSASIGALSLYCCSCASPKIYMVRDEFGKNHKYIERKETRGIGDRVLGRTLFTPLEEIDDVDTDLE